METVIENKRIFGVYQDKTIHWHLNENGNYMINASDIADLLSINLSEFLESKEAKLWISHLINDKSELISQHYNFEDVVLIEKGIYYLHKFLIYKMTNELDMKFYWRFDQILYSKIPEHANGIFI
jgi:hypothetical protein